MFVLVTVMPNDDTSKAPGANQPFDRYVNVAHIVHMDYHDDYAQYEGAPESMITMSDGSQFAVAQSPRSIVGIG